MKLVKLPSLNLSKTASLVTVGAVSGAVVGTTALITYTLLAGKSTASALAAKTALGLQGVGATTASSASNLPGLLLPVSLGAIGGGATSLGVAQKQVRQATQDFEEQTNELREQLQTCEAHIEKNKRTNVPTSTVDLEQIKGIGPKYSQLLQEAGIYTVAELAQTQGKDLHSALERSFADQLFRLDDWIAQAQQMAKKSI